MVHTSGRARRRGPRAGAWPPGPRSAPSTRSSPSPTPSGRSPHSTARRSRSRATTSCVALLADMAEAIGATAVRLAPGLKAAYHAAAVLAAGGFVALLDAIAELGPRRRPRRGRLAGGLRAAHRGDARQRPGPRDPRRADRTDDPRRRRDPGRAPRRRCARTPRASCDAVRRRGRRARSISPRRVARWHRRRRPTCAMRSLGLARPG